MPAPSGPDSSGDGGRQVEGTGCGHATWFRVQGSGFRVQGAGFRVQGAGLRVQGSGTSNAESRVQEASAS